MIEGENIVSHLREREGKGVLQWLQDGVIADGIEIGLKQNDETIHRIISRFDYFLVGLKQKQLEEAIEIGRKLRENENSVTSSGQPGVEGF